MFSTVQPDQSKTAVAGSVARQYVHKNAASEVLLTGWRALGNDTYAVTARWPKDHPFYRPLHGFHDPMLATESIRQALLLLGHVAYDVPFGHPQSWSHFRYTLSSTALLATDGPAEVELHVVCSDINRRSGRLASMVTRIDIVRGGLHVATADIGFASHLPAIYRRLRGRYADVEQAMARVIPLAPPMTPARVAREDFKDVVLSPTDSPTHSQLRVDLNHPALFDHPVDHIPGMLLLEAARQAAHTMSHPRPMTAIAMDALFVRYAELDAPCWIHVDPLPDDDRGRSRVLVSALQNDTCVFSSTTTLEPVPGC
ncbi:ScbA/BarX family gamma-butyrolactone biosynthesis protein [Streptomyces sp. SAS_270]|uniref:ScbA/BarX family gamma-butyrolactone biosynthesis protein n=1 Tax=Streptomyces sp. SAS_270 TaxID=3412748 RepID=UPI00403C9CF5